MLKIITIVRMMTNKNNDEKNDNADVNNSIIHE